MEGRLHGRVVVITGGCGDIGRATAAAFTRAGARVILVDLLAPDEARAALDASEAEAAVYMPCDVCDRAAVRDVIAAIEGQYGGPDVAIANAGITRSTPALAVSQDEWAQVLDVNLNGALHVAQESAAAMVRQERPGVLLFTGSWVGEVPSKGLLPYCVSKAGVQMLARCLALELAPHGIRANVVAPGVLDAGVSAQIFRQFPERRAPFQKIVPLGTLGTAEQVADAFVFLASDAAAYITGATLLVDGGASLFQYSHQ
jgi:NAD(P)-dependent dehydrogenase (short-subunit alcohol dehydrogenase family)